MLTDWAAKRHQLASDPLLVSDASSAGAVPRPAPKSVRSTRRVALLRNSGPRRFYHLGPGWCDIAVCYFFVNGRERAEGSQDTDPGLAAPYPPAPYTRDRLSRLHVFGGEGHIAEFRAENLKAARQMPRGAAWLRRRSPEGGHRFHFPYVGWLSRDGVFHVMRLRASLL